MSDELWGELGELTQRHVALQAFFGHVLALAMEQSISLPNISISTEEGREQYNIARGTIRGYQFLVGHACDNMGDSPKEKEEVSDDWAEPPLPPSRRTSDNRPPVKRIQTPPRRKSAAKTAKKAKTAKRRK